MEQFLAVCDSEHVNKVCEKLKLYGAENFRFVPSGVEFITVNTHPIPGNGKIELGDNSCAYLYLFLNEISIESYETIEDAFKQDTFFRHFFIALADQYNNVCRSACVRIVCEERSQSWCDSTASTIANALIAIFDEDGFRGYKYTQNEDTAPPVFRLHIEDNNM
ncbi:MULTISPECIES: hypothetical protein [unclassified Anaerobiospirillum]|uniref:hypothetical protein n=1 Tax=unclassified Anaerobiospirillum TaxID=2647410 RepID=UPI001FF34F6F|nr:MULTISPECIES: hypothetical protein [unclassified Anaerobiospirillum]MCK0534874.1 hypothetical protein [Anaerobiospirillum sp. NML120511]MCK0540057.1 hypothetical protein [Anaerobiospirillum sp. NML02-A-032]